MSIPARAEARQAGEVRRPLSPMERWYWVCDQISPLNVIARMHVVGGCTRQNLERAGARLAQEHPLLRVAVAAQPDGSGPRFVAARGAPIPVRTVRAGAADAGRWEREVNGVELVSSLDWRSGPLARIVDVARGIPGTVGERHDLLLTVSHVIADGTTALQLLRRLVELAAPRGPAGAPTLEPAVPRPPLSPPEALLPRRVNGLPRAAHLVAAVLADRVTAAVTRPQRLEPQALVPPDRRRTRLIRRELDAGQLDRLIACCRRERVTVHSALAAAMATAVACVAGTAKPQRVCIGAPVDFRAELVPPVGPRDVGAYVATVPSYVRAGPGVDLWTAARGAFRDLHRRKRLHQHLALVAMLRLISPRSAGASARLVAMVDRVGHGNVCLSNIGRHHVPDRVGRWELSGAQFIAGISVSGYLVATVNTSHAALHWNFTYVDGAVSSERAEQIANRAVHVLLSGLRRTEAPAGVERRD